MIDILARVLPKIVSATCWTHKTERENSWCVWLPEECAREIVIEYGGRNWCFDILQDGTPIMEEWDRSNVSIYTLPEHFGYTKIGSLYATSDGYSWSSLLV